MPEHRSADADRALARGGWPGSTRPPGGGAGRPSAPNCCGRRRRPARRRPPWSTARRPAHLRVAGRPGRRAGRPAHRRPRPARGDRIVVQLPNCWQFVVLTLACLRAGIVPVMALPAHRRHELAYLASTARPAAIAVPGPAARLRPPGDGATSCAAGSADAAARAGTGERDAAAAHVDLTALCARARRTRPRDRARLGRRPARQPGRGACSCCPAGPPGCRS